MDHISVTVRRGARLAAGILSVLTLTTVLAARATAAPPPPPPLPGAVGFIDDSGATGCMTNNPEEVAYRTDRVVLRTWLTPQAARNEVVAALQTINPAAQVTVEPLVNPPLPGPITPVLVASLTTPSGGPVPIVRLARKLRHEHELPASPDYLLAPSSGPSGMWPNGYPKPIKDLTPPRQASPGAPSIGSGIEIMLYDTGLAPLTQSSPPANVSQLTSGDVETLDATVPPDQIVDLYYGGHTVAIAGVIATIAPGAAVVAARITEADGIATDVSAARRMANTLRDANQRHDWPDLIVNAFGSPACDEGALNPNADMAPLGLEMVTDAVERHDEALVVASAGNKASSRRFYPAAFDSVLSIGALDTSADADGNPWTAQSRSGPRADFSNYGDWVRGWAPGVRLPTTHVNGLSFDGVNDIYGKAEVDGTSYAAPYVAALIAEEMTTSSLSADEAWDVIDNFGKQCLQSGGGTAVALTSMTAKATTPPAAALPPSTC
jgi:Subtilase family